MRQLIFAMILTLAPLPAWAAELVMFDAKGCYWCDRWMDEVGDYYHKTREGQAAPLRVVSLNKPKPSDLSWLQNVRASPTFVLIDNGREIGRIIGYPGEHLFWMRMESVFRGLQSYRP